MHRSRAILLATLFTLAGGTPLFAQVAQVAQVVSDTQPPTLTALSLSTTAVDVTAGAQSVTVHIEATDDLAGVVFDGSRVSSAVALRSPSGAYYRYVRPSDFSLLTGNALNGVWEAQLTMPQWIEPGLWTVAWVNVQDTTGNVGFLDDVTLASLGLSASLDVTSNWDTTPPALNALTITPPVLDASAGSSVVLTLDITDDLSGADFSDPSQTFVTLNSPPSAPSPFGRGCTAPVLVNGPATAGQWETTCYFPQYSQAGDWPIAVTLSDLAGNLLSVDLAALNLPTFVTVTSTPSDTTVMTLSNPVIGPTFIDTSFAPQDVAVTVHATDDLSGFGGLQLLYQSPSGGQFQYVYAYQLQSGTTLDGDFTGVGTFPRYSEAGTWHLISVFHYDQVFNYQYTYGEANVAALGFPTLINVVFASQTGDGTIDDTGGTVVDATFGARASVALPPGALSGPTDVTIDVLVSPLTFPMPTGYAAPGTNYVNISFNPVPAMPFAPPGVTVTLPLLAQLPVGTSIQLFRVEPTTGLLEPAVSVNGGAVIGAVDNTGLSVTFTGVSKLSVVVGLVVDTTPPVVTPPAPLTGIEALGPAGISVNASAAIAAFVDGGSAVDNFDSAPTRLTAQINGTDVTGTTVFPLGVTTVTFRWRDSAGNIGSATRTVTVVDTTAPTVTPPANIAVTATEAGGARANASAALAAFLAGGSAVDSVDTAPVALTPRIGGVDVTAATLIPLGQSTVTFRFRDASLNVGTATAQVIVTSASLSGSFGIPSPIQVCDGTGQGAVTLTWTTVGASAIEVHLDSPTGPLFSRIGPNAVKATGKYMTEGRQVYLQNVSGGLPLTVANTLATVTTHTTTAGCARTGTIIATPSPLQVCDATGQGTATVTWSNSATVAATEVRIGSPTGQLFSRILGGSAGASKATGKWVEDGMTFYLQDVSGGLPLTGANTLATVSVPVTAAGCP